MRTLRLAAILGVGALVALPSPVALGSPPTRTYEITITNLTSGQPLTPPVVATHRGAYGAFNVGSAASVGVQQIAENGNGGPLLAELSASKHVSDFLETTTGPLVPAGTPGAATFDDSVTLA
ncbi:MAG: spondin domain-containing protein [bacterium]